MRLRWGCFPAPCAWTRPGGCCWPRGGRWTKPTCSLRRNWCANAPSTRKARALPAGFWRGGLLLVCAVEGEDIHTAVYTLAPGTPRPRKLIDLPGQPGGLCVCPDGVGALISTRDGLMKLDIPQGRLLWNLPDLALCARPVLPRPHGAGERDAGRPGAAAFPLQAMAFKNRVYGYGCSCLLFDGIIRGRLAHP